MASPAFFFHPSMYVDHLSDSSDGISKNTHPPLLPWTATVPEAVAQWQGIHGVLRPAVEATVVGGGVTFTPKCSGDPQKWRVI